MYLNALKLVCKDVKDCITLPVESNLTQIPAVNPWAISLTLLGRNFGFQGINRIGICGQGSSIKHIYHAQ